MLIAVNVQSSGIFLVYYVGKFVVGCGRHYDTRKVGRSDAIDGGESTSGVVSS